MQHELREMGSFEYSSVLVKQYRHIIRLPGAYSKIGFPGEDEKMALILANRNS